MAKKSDPNPLIDEALLELAQSGMLRKTTADKITMRILGKAAADKPTQLSANEVRILRETANMSQAVFARLLNVSTGYMSQLERGVKRPTGPALALLTVIKRKGVGVLM
jgi:putative transcriptional regulator